MKEKSGKVILSYSAVFLCAAVLYIGTCAPGAVWQDSGMIQYRVWHNDIEGRLGLALAHPLFYLIAVGARYIPFGQFAYRVNLVSAIMAAAAAANLFLLLRLWLNRNLPAVVGAASLAFSHTFWQHATVPETYNLCAALLLAELIAVLQYCRTGKIGCLYLLGLFNGLAMADHMLASIPFVCYAVFLGVLLRRKQIGLKHLAIIILLWVVGAGPYEYLIIKDVTQTGDFVAVVKSALFGAGYQGDVLNTSLSLRMVKENIMWFGLNFPTPNILLFFVGLYCLYKLAPARSFANLLLSLLILFFVFAFRYTIVDRYAFFIPFYCLVSVLIGLGTHIFLVKEKTKMLAFAALIFTLLPIPAYMVAPTIAEKMQIRGRVRQIPYRDEYQYFLQPWRMGERSAEKFADDVFGTVEKNAVIYADNTTVYALLYAQQVKGTRPDLKIVSPLASSKNAPELSRDTIDKLLAERAVYIVSNVGGYYPDFLNQNYKFVRAGTVWRVKKQN